MTFEVLLYITVFALGACVGSFANVCILRIPAKESIVPSSHCVHCGRKLRWYELVPIFSFLALRGRCRECNAPISLQYPLVEGINGLVWVLVFFAVSGEFIISGTTISLATPITVLLTAFIFCLASTALLIVAVIDWYTMEIPPSLNIAIAVLGCFRLALDYTNWNVYLIGAVCVSGVLLLLWLITGGRALGGGDIKLMAACGLLLGWKLIIAAFLLGCVIGTLVHVARMIVSKAGRTLAFGPYLATGVFIAMLYGEQLLNWYLNLYAW